MLSEFLNDHKIAYETDIPLSKKTWIKTGGKCRFFITPTNLYQMEMLVRYLYSKDIPFDVVGATSNCFFTNEYNPKVVISTLRMSNVTDSNECIVCDCGVLVSKLSKQCVSNGYGGFSGLVNLPGTIAAAIYGNAGCFGCSLAAIVDEVTLITPDTHTGGTILTLSKNDLRFLHRSSALKRGEIQGVILSAKFLKIISDKEREKRKSEYATIRRKTTQEPPAKNLGSVYGTLVYRRNAKNAVAFVLKTLFRYLHIANNGMTVYKHLQLWQYGYTCLDRYISDKNINTFMWIDENSEKMFGIYQEFMNRVYKNPKLEIEIRR